MRPKMGIVSCFIVIDWSLDTVEVADDDCLIYIFWWLFSTNLLKRHPARRSAVLCQSFYGLLPSSTWTARPAAPALSLPAPARRYLGQENQSNWFPGQSNHWRILPQSSTVPGDDATVHARVVDGCQSQSELSTGNGHHLSLIKSFYVFGTYFTSITLITV